MRPGRASRAALAAALVGAQALLLAGPALGWGNTGHLLVNEAAARALPERVPPFLRERVAELTWLGPHPDRWRASDQPQLQSVASPDHFINLEMAHLPGEAPPPPDRWAFAHHLLQAGEDPSKVGFAPYRVIELCQQLELEVAAALLVDPADPQAPAYRRQAEDAARVTAGILGHYVADLGNPHHTSVHYNGWKGDNPEGFTTDRQIHWRFEEDFVSRVAAQLDLRVTAPARDDVDYAAEIWRLVRDSQREVTALYRLEKSGAFAPGREQSEAGLTGQTFARARLLQATTLLRDLWTTACARGAARATEQLLEREIKNRLAAAGMPSLWVEVALDGRVSVNGRVDTSEQAEQVLEIVRGLAGDRKQEFRIRVRH